MLGISSGIIIGVLFAVARMIRYLWPCDTPAKARLLWGMGGYSELLLLIHGLFYILFSAPQGFVVW